jgi:hypothetical protein
MASARAVSTKVPPVFRENGDYDQWKKDVQLWTILTDLDEGKHAIAVHLSLTGRARNASSELTVDEINGSGGMKMLFDKLDRVFEQDENWKCFNTYLAFENYRRSKECSIDEYLSEFDLRHHKLRECKVVLPDAVIACRLLKSCGLSDVNFQLALSTTPKMTFEDMRTTLKKLFTESGHLLTGEAACSGENVKVEPVLENEAFYGGSSRARGRSRRGGMRPTYRGPVNYRHDSAVSARSNSTYNRNNPLNPD